MPGKKRCCYKCPKRTQWCHGSCQDYAAEREDNKNRLEEERKERLDKETFRTPAFERREREALNRMK
ncbi:MAG: hypothetical protein IKL57_01035 [Oscillospiraceae bacterium]|nr:hypothetical protein [Oscillospiraceae bacterium]